ncbi:hypothetical protein J40TS1_20680 [Paenibacillus montaniterrae]|uniref:6-bladed beta-propeller n=1 Tax=Paenibacillus montaniterrae TaxID=429341 RepID=A0A919YQE9_9BACL|nr:NHL repeat-containing protein [Paenibacillus montaniterrae]GIP16426.1 hypothetical protein J40TS1_20680 [Paenibacillus montaniterrae]
MAKMIKLIAILAALTVLFGCSSNSNSNKWPTNMDTLELIEEPEFTITGKFQEELALNNPTSMIWVNESLYITDTGNDRIVVIDREGNLIRSIGEAGNGLLQFIKPTGITADEDSNIYVVDSGNNRVQVINKDDQYVKQYRVDQFPYSPKSSVLHDIVYLNNTVYVSTQTMDQSWATIIAISEDESVQTIGESISGHVVSVDDYLYFVSEGEYKKVEEGLSFESGRNYLLRILQNNEIGDVYELPYKYTAGGIESHEGHLYMFSKRYFSIDRYDLEGNYITTVYRFEGELDELMGLETLTFAGDDIFVLNSMTNTIYYLKKDKQ